MGGVTPPQFRFDPFCMGGSTPHRFRKNVDRKTIINRVPRAPPWLIFIGNTEQDMGNPILRTPRPGDPYLYELCPPEIFRKIGILGGRPTPLVHDPIRMPKNVGGTPPILPGGDGNRTGGEASSFLQRKFMS